MNSRISESIYTVSDAAPHLSRVISSATLLGKGKSIVILHDGQRYVLSLTKLRKLILTK